VSSPKVDPDALLCALILGVSKEELQRVITAAGPMVADVERELSKSRT